MFRKSSIGLIFALILALTAVLPGGLFAQSIAASASGTVLDQSGAVIPGVEVVLTNDATGESRTATTNETGEFVFTNLQPGTYSIKIERTGFRGLNRKNIVSICGLRWSSARTVHAQLHG